MLKIVFLLTGFHDTLRDKWEMVKLQLGKYIYESNVTRAWDLEKSESW